MEVEAVIVNDDVAVEDSLYTAGRRGIAGTIFVHKIAGGSAQAGGDLPEVKRLAEKVTASVRSMGFALAPCTAPKVGKPTFTLDDREMEMGIGIHGEPGTRRTQLMRADEIVQTLMDRIIGDLPFKGGDEVAVMINGLGGTPLMELYVMNREVSRILKEKKIHVYRTWVGEFMTSLEMAGASVTLFRLDRELKSYLNAAAETVAWKIE
jgi:dihydroxyacetone kinase-like protein